MSGGKPGPACPAQAAVWAASPAGEIVGIHGHRASSLSPSLITLSHSLARRSSLLQQQASSGASSRVLLLRRLHHAFMKLGMRPPEV